LVRAASISLSRDIVNSQENNNMMIKRPHEHAV